MSKEQETSGVFVDFGSSTIKVGSSTGNIPPSIETIYYNNRNIIGVPLDGGWAQIKIVSGEELKHIATAIKARVPNELTALSITSAKKPVYVWRQTPDGIQEALILDDPSLTTDPTDEEEQLIRGTLHLDKPIDPNNPLIKILALRHNPALVEYLFGQQATFEELKFGTLATFVRRVFGDPDPRVGRNYVLAFGMNGSQETDVISLVERLGLSSQLQFEEETIVRRGPTEIQEGDDFRIELDALKAIFEEGLFPPGSIIIAADSVGKVIDLSRGDGSWGRLDSKQVARYKTLRTFGQANNWLKPLVANQAVQRGVPPEALVDEVLRSGYAPKNWYFDPHGNKENGAIYTRRKGGKWIEVPENELTSEKYRKHREAIIRAVAWGVALAIAELVPQSNQNGNIYVYGGLVGEYAYGKNLGWRRIIRAVMPKNREIYLVKLSSAATAMWITYMQQTGQCINISEIVAVEPLSGDNNRRTGSGIRQNSCPSFL